MWQLQRAILRIREDQRDGIAGLRENLRADLQVLAGRIEQAVTKDVCVAHQHLTEQRLAVLERDLAAEVRARPAAEDSAAAARRWLIGAFAAPLVVAPLQLWMLSKGGHP
ncbi:hypothetical protein [Kitasatospora sp. NPDC005751]|uniref:hypothetical protein n=1 Tax=Kitasatospora sp. NPDC005751 TaxID=3157064 RepID=UPI0033D4686D